MKIYYFCLLLLFMEKGSYADIKPFTTFSNNLTTTTSPSATNETTTSSTQKSAITSFVDHLKICDSESIPREIPKNILSDADIHEFHYPEIPTIHENSLKSPPIPTLGGNPETLNKGNAYSPESTFQQNPDSPFDYQVCGASESYNDLNCACWNNTLTCSPRSDCYGWSCPIFNSLNIKIMQENFTAKIVFFTGNFLNILQKDKVLPGIEHIVEILQLSGNRITNIENGALDNFTSLKEMDLSRNENLSENELFAKYIFPKALGNLTKLMMARCGITVIGDQAFVNLVSLEKLVLYGNPITSFPTTLNYLRNLKYLNLDETQISSLNNTGTNSNTKLEKLYLAKTSLTFIGDCAFCNYPNLKELRLYQNYNLTFIHENAFGYAYNGTSPPLEKFSLEYCNLQLIPEELLNWHNISKFGLGNNPFMCNCSMAWLINDILSPTHSINLQKVAPHPFMTYPSDLIEIDIPGIPDTVNVHNMDLQYAPTYQLPYPAFVDPSANLPVFSDDGLKCFYPHALKHVKFIQISKNFCPNEVKKNEQQKFKEQSALVNSSVTNISWMHIGIAIIIFVFGIVVGIFVIHFGRYFYRQKKQEYGFDTFSYRGSTVQEDFDDGKY